MAGNLAILLTTGEAASYLGVSVERVLYWARDGLLRVTAQTETGDLLFRRHELDAKGEELAALAPVRRPRKHQLVE
jgi:excisionase family DNA binding protein